MSQEDKILIDVALKSLRIVGGRVARNHKRVPQVRNVRNETISIELKVISSRFNYAYYFNCVYSIT